MKSIIITILIGFAFFCCSDNDDNETQNNCDFETLISEEEFENAPNDQLAIQSLEIDENCLKISFSASGCDGNTWEVKLIDSGNILEAMPPQRNLRLSLMNNEACLAVITKEMSFNISNLKLENNQVMLNITNSDDSILYEY